MRQSGQLQFPFSSGLWQSPFLFVCSKTTCFWMKWTEFWESWESRHKILFFQLFPLKSVYCPFNCLRISDSSEWDRHSWQPCLRNLFHHSSNASNSFRTNLWLSWGFNLYSQWGFHFHRHMRSLPYTIPANTTAMGLLHHQERCCFLRNYVTKRLEDVENPNRKCFRRNLKWALAKPLRFLSLVNDGNW